METVALQVCEELAGAEASVAWIAWVNSLPCFSSAVLSDDSVRRELFGDTKRLFASSTRPSGRAVVADGGFRVTGRWSLVSGCELADWIPVMGVIIEGTEPRLLAPGIPEVRMADVPKGSYRILDTWHVGGLRGTGSHDVVVEDVFVPAELTYSLLDPIHIDRLPYRMPGSGNPCRNFAVRYAHFCRGPMSEACSQSDLVHRRIAWVVWEIPAVLLVVGGFIGPGVQTLLWPLALVIMGARCMVNAARCGRLHCYMTGPLYLIAAIASVLLGLELAALQWSWIALWIVGGTAYCPQCRVRWVWAE